MKITFLGQGLNNISEKAAGKALIKSFQNPAFNKFIGIVAFAHQNGVNLLKAGLRHSNIRKRNIKLYVGVDLILTSKEALQSIIELGVDSYIIHTRSPQITFHPKIYIFDGARLCRIIIGSSNLTQSGLFTNIEASLSVEFDKTETDGLQLQNEIFKYYRKILLGTDPNVKKLTRALLNKLVALGIVTSESRRARLPVPSNGSDGSGQADTRNTQQLNQLFPSRRVGKVPAYIRTRRLRREEERIVATPPASAISSVGYHNSFWIQTGALTGGSGNQIDLSMRGPHGSAGSVSLFGINPSNRTTQARVDLEYNGLTYVGNLIKFRTNNGTWRLNANGRTSTGSTLTSICRTTFKHKILLFEQLDGARYSITVLDSSQLNTLKGRSRYWDQNSTSRGLHFGQL